jgi:GNAT superfamily N-acetyltransferase
MTGLPQTTVKPRCSLEIRRGGLEDTDSIEEMLSYVDRAALREELREYFAGGGELFLGFSEGKLVHAAWLHFCAGTNKLYPHVKIRDDEAFIGRCETHAEFRGKNIYPVALQHLVKGALEKGVRRCFITTSPTLSASIRGIEKAGFSFAGKLRRFSLFGKVFNSQWVSSDRLSTS